MKNFVILLLLAGFVFGCAESTSQENLYGDALTVSETTNISAILANPDAYLGKQVLVEGHVLNVCEKRGCWMEIAGDEAYQSIRVKVDDGVIVFPMEAQGKKARVQGEFYKIEMTADEARDYLAHQAEEKGEPFDTTAAVSPMTLYQIKGMGAVIAD